jgi:2-polyprenyl-3-methyl-5-hydroxy-6-metoxy-1,4-benzoquinol methylase
LLNAGRGNIYARNVQFFQGGDKIAFMIDDYIEHTLAAYDANPEQYEAATVDIVAVQELKEFVEGLPTRELPVLDAGCAFGRDTTLLAKEGLTVVGIDYRRACLKERASYIQQLNLKRWMCGSWIFRMRALLGFGATLC